MIAILLNDASFEQDIRELLMAFYPGETVTHKEEEAGEADLIVIFLSSKAKNSRLFSEMGVLV